MDESKIEMTEDYAIFKHITGNRKVDSAHVQKLVKAMRSHDLFTPIMVNGKMEVIDGQHRLEARKILKLIVPYYVVENYGLAEVQTINSQQKKWTVEDYTQSYIELGKKDYEIYRWFRKTYKMPHLTSVALLSGHSLVHGGKLSSIFNDGLFKVTELENAKAKGVMLEKVAPYFEGYKDRSFINALLICAEKPVFDFPKFVKKLETRPLALKKCATTAQYIDLIEEVYNYKSQVKVSLKYSEYVERDVHLRAVV